MQGALTAAGRAVVEGAEETLTGEGHGQPWALGRPLWLLSGARVERGEAARTGCRLGLGGSGMLLHIS